ncbi:unnamed protein product [Enterobius vermicularis]|uniref:Mediator of RNA polymerase II transcription subunit 23 n=1 Tax=Enterobius vermicularis TaxID=51028 RepID=A0A0N4V0J4_ENTVE|nr:unnamed protein product [Enterobius vermicularis]
MVDSSILSTENSSTVVLRTIGNSYWTVEIRKHKLVMAVLDRLLEPVGYSMEPGQVGLRTILDMVGPYSKQLVYQ